MEKRAVAIDLETIADPNMLEILPEVTAKKNLVNPEKIEADIAEKKLKQVEEMGLNPMMNLICCAGWCDKDGAHSLSITKADYESEKKLLLDFWEVLSNYTHFITFNGRSFDIRVMLLHGITHGIRPSVNIDSGRYNRGNHIDLRQILAGPDTFAKGKLDFFCKKYLGVGKMEGIDGAEVQNYFDMGLHKEIADYNEDETGKMFQLYEKVEIAGLLE